MKWMRLVLWLIHSGHDSVSIVVIRNNGFTKCIDGHPYLNIEIHKRVVDIHNSIMDIPNSIMVIHDA